MISPKDRYRIQCAREVLEEAAEKTEEAMSWLEVEYCSTPTEIRYCLTQMQIIMATIAYLDTILADM